MQKDRHKYTYFETSKIQKTAIRALFSSIH